MRKPLLIALIVFAVIFGGGVIFFYQPTAGTIKGDSNSTNSDDTGSSQSSSGSGNEIFQIRTHDTVGKYLADSDDLALYTYDADKDGASMCDETCLSAWPAYTIDFVPDNLPANVSVITRSDNGASQLAYKDKPLYYFTSDGSGEVNGDSLDGFRVAKP